MSDDNQDDIDELDKPSKSGGKSKTADEDGPGFILVCFFILVIVALIVAPN